jgi:glycosyltransferase involved in cell wall biosynthesis
MKTTIIIPSYNEMKTLPAVLNALSGVALEKEVIVVDDGSRDGTREWLDKVIAAKEFPFELRIIKHEENAGKGGALLTGFSAASGDIVIVQDADLEYDPNCIPSIVKPIEEDKADVVFGSRFLHGKADTYNILYLWGNLFLTFLVNLFFGSKITDSYTCYKAFRAPLLKKMRLISTGFEIEAEMSCKMAFLGFRFEELSVTYASRSRHEGKKINYKDAIKGVLKILCLRLTLRRSDFN